MYFMMLEMYSELDVLHVDVKQEVILQLVLDIGNVIIVGEDVGL